MRRWELRNAPFLEASHRSWKGGGAKNGEERSVETWGIKGRMRRQVEVFLLLVVSSSSLRRTRALSFVVGRLLVVDVFVVVQSFGGFVERRGAFGLVVVWGFVIAAAPWRSSSGCLPSGRRVVRVGCGGPGSRRAREESAGESSPTIEEPRGCR